MATTSDLFPRRIETDRLVFQRLRHDGVDPFEFYEFVSRDAWQGDATEHMPWFRLRRPDQVLAFVDRAEQQWADGESARYLLRSRADDDAIVGTAAYSPEWEKRVGGSDVVASGDHPARGIRFHPPDCAVRGPSDPPACIHVHLACASRKFADAATPLWPSYPQS